jgi:hypothetical protein
MESLFTIALPGSHGNKNTEFNHGIKSKCPLQSCRDMLKNVYILQYKVVVKTVPSR